MALNFTVSYTFSPSTTISSSQVNTNTSDVAAVFQGLEAETKSLAKLKVDIDPTLALEVATKQYVDHYSTWRRPVLKYASATTVSIESGLDGTSGNIPMLFPDGSVRTETSATRTTFDITRNAVLVTSGAQSGLTGATSEANNTWYALYAVKVTDSSTQWVTVGSTVIPTQGNYATLNTAYGTSGWVYLGLIRNGDGASAAADLISFKQAGNLTVFSNRVSGNGADLEGLRLATSAGATSITYQRTNGTGATDIPVHIQIGIYAGGCATGSTVTNFRERDQAVSWQVSIGTAQAAGRWTGLLDNGFQVSNGSSVGMDILLSGIVDGVLGVGSNPLL